MSSYVDCENCNKQILNRGDLVVAIATAVRLKTFHLKCWQNRDTRQYLWLSPINLKHGGFGAFYFVWIFILLATILSWGMFLVYPAIKFGGVAEAIERFSPTFFAYVVPTAFLFLLMTAGYFNAKRIAKNTYWNKLPD